MTAGRMRAVPQARACRTRSTASLLAADRGACASTTTGASVPGANDVDDPAIRRRTSRRRRRRCRSTPAPAVFVGITPVGQPCQFALECEKGAHCVFNKLTPAAGVCEPYQKRATSATRRATAIRRCRSSIARRQDWKCHLRAKLGEKCAFTVDAAAKPALPLLIECDNTIGNIYCDPLSATCKQLPAAGEPCLSPPPPGVTSSCDPDPKLHLSCRTSGTSSSGVCTGPGEKRRGLHQTSPATRACTATARPARRARASRCRR